jgi:hydrogenase/urease accessory protein HupE
VASTERIVSQRRHGSSLLRLVAWALLLGVLAPGRSLGHGLDPASLSLRETTPGVFEVVWRASGLRLPGANVEPSLPQRCRPLTPAAPLEDADRIALHWTVDCGPGGLAGETIGVDDLAAAKINALLSLQQAGTAPIETVLGPRTPSFVVPVHPSRWDIARSYLSLGVGHILTGPDHLLFVFGLLLLVSASRLLVQTITAFTLGHSLTLTAAALHLASVPSRPVEVLIALSVLVLAVELARDPSRETLLRRFPWAMAIMFGLLHGFGFAGALAEAGLPADAIPLALVSFNGGIEIGQLIFVGAVLAVGALLAWCLPNAAVRTTRPAVYAMGILAAFWCFERLAVWLA